MTMNIFDAIETLSGGALTDEIVRQLGSCCGVYREDFEEHPEKWDGLLATGLMKGTKSLRLTKAGFARADELAGLR